MKYQAKPAQEQRILELLRQRGESGVASWEIPALLHCLQYNARIFGLRKKGYGIENKDDRFKLTYDPDFKEGQGILFNVKERQYES